MDDFILIHPDKISIHAPARGATWRNLYRCDQIAISIHAPARGATQMHLKTVVQILFQSTRPRGARQIVRDIFGTVKSFQSTRPRGARQRGNRYCSRRAIISIHAPARGATWALGSPSAYAFYFNPRAREGRDRKSSLAPIHMPYFNPRAREGRDSKNQQ